MSAVMVIELMTTKSFLNTTGFRLAKRFTIVFVVLHIVTVVVLYWVGKEVMREQYERRLMDFHSSVSDIIKKEGIDNSVQFVDRFINSHVANEQPEVHFLLVDQGQKRLAGDVNNQSLFPGARELFVSVTSDERSVHTEYIFASWRSR